MTATTPNRLISTPVYTEETFPSSPYEALATEIHRRNVAAGWWTDLTTQQSTLATRDRGRIMMLIVSEVSEADLGEHESLMDDKLPHLPMFDVELADVAIRLFDIIGAENSLYGNILPLDYRSVRDAARVDNLNGADWFRQIVNSVSAALEFERKTRTEQYRVQLQKTLAITFGVAAAYGIDLMAVIVEKLEFNANRADHKVENRLKADGKKT